MLISKGMKHLKIKRGTAYSQTFERVEIIRKEMWLVGYKNKVQYSSTICQHKTYICSYYNNKL